MHVDSFQGKRYDKDEPAICPAAFGISVRTDPFMKKIVDDTRLMIKVCDLYYNENISQVNIAKNLGLSRPTIARLLSSARDLGIVQIRISNLEEVRYWELERRLEKKLGLKEVIVADCGDSEDDMKKNLGLIAGRYLVNHVHDGDLVGISMGSVLHQVVEAVENPAASDVTFIPLIGGMGQLSSELHSNNLAEKLSAVYGGKYIPIYAPARVSNPKIRAELLNEPNISRAIKLADRLDLAFVGIGYPHEYSSISMTGYYGENEMESLIERNVAGDICMQFFDVTGDTAPFARDNYVIGVDIKKLRKVPLSVGTAGGISKLPAIKGAVNGGYINVLITDITCADALDRTEDPAGDADGGEKEGQSAL